MKLFSDSDEQSIKYIESSLDGRCVYIVEHGSYSDRRIVAVFSDEDDAISYCSKLDDCDYQAFEINKEANIARGDNNYYAVSMYFDGQVLDIWKSSPFEWLYDDFHIPTLTSSNDKRPDAFRFKTLCVAKNESHAIKIAGERRIKMIHDGLLARAVKFEEERKEKKAKDLENQLKMDQYKSQFKTIMDLSDNEGSVDMLSILKRISDKDNS